MGVHCELGLGRTGTMLACYLVSQGREGYSAGRAILKTRRRRTESIETSEQERAVGNFERFLKEPASSRSFGNCFSFNKRHVQYARMRACALAQTTSLASAMASFQRELATCRFVYT